MRFGFYVIHGLIILIQPIFKTRNGESADENENGNGERGTGNL